MPTSTAPCAAGPTSSAGSRSASERRRTEANFSQFEQAAITSVLRVDKGKAAAIVGAMASDADEYLRASIQRGDTYTAGKVEYHQGGAYDLGTIWTPSDKTLIVTTQSE